jgi:hypothetical protein
MKGLTTEQKKSKIKLYLPFMVPDLVYKFKIIGNRVT